MTASELQTLKRALYAYDQGRAQEARPLLEGLLAHHPANFDVNETLGLIHAETGDLSGALPLLEHAARLAPQRPLGRANLGTAYLKLGRQEQALTELEAAARLDPRNRETQIALAQACMQTNASAKAARAFAAAAALGALDADTAHDRALALLLSKDAVGAARVLAAVPAAERTDAIESLAGETDEQLGKYREAEQHYSAAAHLNPSEANVYNWVVELLRHFAWQPAVKVAEYGIGRYPASQRLQAARGIAFYADNRYKEAAGVFSALLATDPENASYASLLGRSCALLSETDAQSCDGLERFAAQHPRNAEAATSAATSLLHRAAPERDDARARALLTQAIAAAATLPDAYYQLGVLEQQEQHWQESAAPLERATALKPAFAEAHYRLARCYAHLGRREEAAKQIALQQQYAKEQKDSLDARLKEVTTFLTTTP